MPLIWVWLKSKELGLRGFSLYCHLPGIHFGYPQPFARKIPHAYNLEGHETREPPQGPHVRASCMSAASVPASWHTEPQLEGTQSKPGPLD